MPSGSINYSGLWGWVTTPRQARIRIVLDIYDKEVADQLLTGLDNMRGVKMVTEYSYNL
jgi:hypothetical protein